MAKNQLTTLVLELKEPPRFTTVRDLSNIFTTINTLYTYYILLSDPRVQAKVEAKVRASEAKDLKSFFYSSSLEKMVPISQRLHLVGISKASPVKISLDGIGTAIDALRRLFEMFTPIYWAMKELEKKRQELEITKLELEVRTIEMEVKKKGLKAQWEHEASAIDHIEFVSSKINALDIPPELKQYLFDALVRNMRSIELNPVKPMLAA